MELSIEQYNKGLLFMSDFLIMVDCRLNLFELHLEFSDKLDSQFVFMSTSLS